MGSMRHDQARIAWRMVEISASVHQYQPRGTVTERRFGRNRYLIHDIAFCNACFICLA